VGAGRYLLAPGPGLDSPITLKRSENSPYPQASSIMQPGEVIIRACLLWALFGLLVALGNLLYRFSVRSFGSLFAVAFILYPVIALASLLTIGYWGIGFVPAAVLSARFISIDGKRLAASGVLTGAVFIITIFSFLIIP